MVFGAEIVQTAAEMWERCDFVAKVKEIEASEYGFLREGQIHEITPISSIIFKHIKP